MIHKNVIVGDVEEVTICELGSGDVQVSSVDMPSGKSVAVTFVNTEANPIGTEHETSGLTTDQTGLDLMIEFSDLKSIEVVEKYLNHCKKRLKQLQAITSN